ncbi:MAG: DUF5060 domain-containing protein [Candidatus Pacebacteria bacterium]|nr:DUF5060 domain-containing protein [Candidatus Paceibacterota bacterium]
MKINKFCLPASFFFFLASFIFFVRLFPAQAQTPNVGLYDIFEMEVVNSRNYANPFNFEEIELRATFTHQNTGRQIEFFGFYDGDGNWENNGNIWKIRFMPDRLGIWNYTYFWAGTGIKPAGSSGSFNVISGNIPGPPKLKSDNSQVMIDSRGNPIHWRGYSIKHLLYHEPLTRAGAQQYIEDNIEGLVVGGGYNATYIAVPNHDHWRDGDPQGGIQPIWGDYERFNLAAAHYFDEIMFSLHQHRIWTIGWITFTYNHSWSTINGQTEMNAFLQKYQRIMRWFTARYGAFYNYFMWSPAWEMDLRTGETWRIRVDAPMEYLKSIDPWQRLQGAHDRAPAEWQDWQSILPRQQNVGGSITDLFTLNDRTEGRQPREDGSGGYVKLTVPYPRVVIGAEDLWESDLASFPSNGTEVRRMLWGSLLANVLPLYEENNEFSPPAGGLGNGEGEPFVKIAYDWWYDRIDYQNKDFKQLNNLVSKTERQAASGIPGSQYVVYDEDGGQIGIDLSGVPSAKTFSVLWFNPINKAEQNGANISGGSRAVLNSPFSGDSVCLIREAGSPTPTPTTTPRPTTTPLPTPTGSPPGIVLEIKHEDDLSEYDLFIADGGDLSQSSTASLGGTGGGLRLLIDDNNPLFGEAGFSQLTSGEYRFRFYLNPDNLEMADYDLFLVSGLFYGTSTRVQVMLRRDNLGFQVNARAADDTGAWRATPYYRLAGGEHYLEVLVAYAAGADTQDGALSLWIDGVFQGQKSGIDLYERAKPDKMQLGAINGIDSGTRGVLYLDEFILRNDGFEIGPTGNQPTPTPTPSYLWGDVNHDGQVNQQDSRSVFDYWRGLFPGVLYEPDSNGRINGADWGFVLRDWGA